MSQSKNPKKLSDEELVIHITDKDQEAFVYIVERYQEPLKRYAYTYVFDHDITADIVQNSFVKAYQNLRGFDTKRKFSSWMYRIVHNESVNYIKKHKKEIRPDEEWFDNLPSEKASLDEEFDKNLKDSEIAQAIAKLPDKYQRPLILSIYEHKSYEEIGEILKIPPVTVGTRINRAKSKLRKELKHLEATHV